MSNYATSYSQLHYSQQSNAILSNRHFLRPPFIGYRAPKNIFTSQPRFGINPQEWGPNAWEFLYSVAKGYPIIAGVKDKVQMRNFLQSLQFALPCHDCRNNFATELKRLTDDDLSSADKLNKWLTKVRNTISERNGKIGNKQDDLLCCHESKDPEEPQICTKCGSH